MKRWMLLAGCAVLVCVLAKPSPAHSVPPSLHADQRQPSAVRGTDTTRGIIVKLHTYPSGAVRILSTAVMQSMSAAAGVSLAFERPMSGDAFVLSLPAEMQQDEAQIIASTLAALPYVDYASPVLRVHAAQAGAGAALVPNDPGYSAQWHYFAPAANAYGINLPSAWSQTTGSPDVVVAVLDTGIRFDHPDLAGRTVAGYDMIGDVFVGNDGDGRDADASDPGDYLVEGDPCYEPDWYNDSSWHGTHVAGTIGAASNNGVGVAGVNWASKILPVRVLGRCGGYDSDVIDAVRWAAGMPVPGVPNNATPAKVINLSLGSDRSCTTAWQNAINDVVARGVVVVAAAGNSGIDAANFTPANCNGVISVAATNRNGKRAWFSNYGSTVEVAAPGGDDGILSTYNAGATVPGASTYSYLQGTSMAAPHVAGVASLLFSINLSLTPAQVLSILQNTVTAFPGGTCDSNVAKSCGPGVVNAGAAVAVAQSLLPAPTATGTATPTPTATGTATPTPTPTATGTATPTPAPTATGTATPTPTPTATGTATPTPTPTATWTPPPEPEVVIVDVDQGAVLTTTGGAQFSFPAGVFTDTTVVSFTARPSNASPADGSFQFLGKAYDMEAHFVSTGLPAQPALGQTYTVRIPYDEAEIGNVDERELKLYVWDGAQWVAEPTSQVDTVNNVLTATPSHFSTWAFGLVKNRVFAPLVRADRRP